MHVQKCYLGKKVFVGPHGMVKSFDEQSKELFDDQTQASDLVRAPPSTSFRDTTRALAIGVRLPVFVCNIK